MPRPTVDQLFNLLRFNTNGIFNVAFNRRTTRPDGTATAGDARTMICRVQGCDQFTQGIIPPPLRDAEDFKHGILTVWSLDVYWALQARGIADLQAAFQSWRRVDLVTLQTLSVLPAAQLPPDLRGNLHQITNAYRLANLPRLPI